MCENAQNTLLGKEEKWDEHMEKEERVKEKQDSPKMKRRRQPLKTIKTLEFILG